MKEEEAIKKAIEYVNLFGYIQWNELKSIDRNNEMSVWTVLFSAKEKETGDIIPYSLEVNDLSGNITNLQMNND